MMRMVRRVAVVLVAALLAGCVSETVAKRRPRRGPVAEVGYIDPGGGEVRYSVEGWGLWVKGRRASALRRARRICKPLKAVIVDEFTRQELDVPYSHDDLKDNIDRGLSHYNLAPYEHLMFECRPPETKEPAPKAPEPVETEKEKR